MKRHYDEKIIITSLLIYLRLSIIKLTTSGKYREGIECLLRVGEYLAPVYAVEVRAAVPRLDDLASPHSESHPQPALQQVHDDVGELAPAALLVLRHRADRGERPHCEKLRVQETERRLQKKRKAKGEKERTLKKR